MPDEPTPESPAEEASKTGDTGDFKQILTPEDMSKFLRERDLVVSQRVARERERYSDYDDLKAKAEAHDAAVEAARTDAERAVEAARKEGEQTATERANTRLVGAEARALAAEAKFRSPASAVRLLDLTGVTVGDDGEPDREAIRAKLAKLAEDEPWHIDSGTEQRPRPRPDATQGGSGAPVKGGLVGLSGGDLYDRLHPKKPA